MRLAATLVFAAVLLTAIAYLRTPEYDEAYSIFLTAGDPRPAWPTGVFHPADVRHLYAGTSSLAQIAHDLRQGDVHPPLYFWILEFWRRVFGPSWFAARMLSVVFTLGSLAALAWLARMMEIPVIPALLVALLAYGFAYTGIVARGFALAQMLNIFGVASVFWSTRQTNPVIPAKAGIFLLPHGALALIGGLALGAASFSNYLSCFVGLAGLLWLTLKHRRLLVPASLGFAVFLPADAWFFAAQRNSRASQFGHFSPLHALALLAKDSGAALFGGLPVYAGSGATFVACSLFLLFMICIGFVLARRTEATPLLGMLSIAPPIGLLALGLVFNKTPIEIRYLAFSLPFAALLFAQALPSRLLIFLLAVESLGIAGLALAPATMQPQAAAAHEASRLATPQTLVLVPYGNDGVGVPGPFIAAAPDDLRIQLIHGALPDLQTETRVITATINVDDSSRAANQNSAAALNSNPCWRVVVSTILTTVYARICHAALPAH
jgi:hypothetical protein